MADTGEAAQLGIKNVEGFIVSVTVVATSILRKLSQSKKLLGFTVVVVGLQQRIQFVGGDG